MKSEKFAHTTMFLAIALMASIGYSGQLAFFPFTDGSDGTEANTVSDTSGTYTGTAQKTNDNGQKPKFSSDSPGQVVDPGTGVICAAPQSLAFRYKYGDDDHDRQSGYVDIPGLATALAGRSAFTVEYFVKMDASFNYYSTGYQRISKTAFYLRSSTSAFKQIAPTECNGSYAKNLALQRFADSVNSSEATITFNKNNLSDGEWHHVAITFGETNQATHAGTLAFYVDGECIGGTQYVNTSGSDLMFRLGSGYKNADGTDKLTTESINASLSCLRVCDTALEPEEFMRADSTPDTTGLGILAFYSFNDGESGAAATTATNSVNEYLFPGTGANIGSGTVTYSSERPARYVFSDSHFSSVLAENPQSLYFYHPSASNGGKMSLSSLATSIMRKDEYTVEFFFKMETTDDYRTLVGWRFGDDVAVKANMRYWSDQCIFETKTEGNANVGQAGLVSRGIKSAWHHFAAVYTKTDNSVRTYIDGVASDVASAVTNRYTTGQYPIVLGTSAFSGKESTEAFGGYISCLRVTPRALSTEAFMTAADELVPPNTVFAINFNEGTTGDRVLPGTDAKGTTEVPIYPDGGYANIAYNLHLGCTPKWGAACRPGRMVLWNAREMWENSRSLYFPAGSNASGEYEQYYGAMFNRPIRVDDGGFRWNRKNDNPTSWTMESFVKLEKYDLPNAPSTTKRALIFGKAGNTEPTRNNPVWYPRSSWLLSYTSEGKLRLDWTERPTPDFTAYDETTTSYYKSVETGVTRLADLKWHHVALSYDASAKQFVIYVDRSMVLTQPLLDSGESNALFDGNYPYYFGRFPTTAGFEGWMDEVRFSSKVLQPEEFERFPSQGMLLFVY